MEQLVDNVACNKGTLLAMRSSSVMFLFQVVWRMRKRIGSVAAADSGFHSKG